ncbi:MAG: serine protease [Burkholderiaceae bacterium]
MVLIGMYSATANPRFGFRGTGFVVGSGNLAVTNAHVLPEAQAAQAEPPQVAVEVWAGPNQWAPRMAKVLVVDRIHDLAVLRFEGAGVPAATLAAERPGEGASVAFMGFPIGGALGYSHVTHRGIISSIAAIGLPARTAQQLNENAIRLMRQENFEIYQLDATAYPGNSGGPIFDPQTGAVIGVMNSVLVKGSRESALSQPSGISYGIPIRHVLNLLQELP